MLIAIGDPSQFYNPSTNFWKPTNGGSGGPVALLANGKVLAVAGSSAQLYDPSTNEWTQTGGLNQAIFDGLTLTRLLNGQVLAAGGRIETHTTKNGTTSTIISPVASAELYTP